MTKKCEIFQEGKATAELFVWAFIVSNRPWRLTFCWEEIAGCDVRHKHTPATSRHHIYPQWADCSWGVLISHLVLRYSCTSPLNQILTLGRCKDVASFSPEPLAFEVHVVRRKDLPVQMGQCLVDPRTFSGSESCMFGRRGEFEKDDNKTWSSLPRGILIQYPTRCWGMLRHASLVHLSVSDPCLYAISTAPTDLQQYTELDGTDIVDSMVETASEQAAEPGIPELPWMSYSLGSGRVFYAHGTAFRRTRVTSPSLSTVTA